MTAQRAPKPTASSAGGRQPRRDGLKFNSRLAAGRGALALAATLAGATLLSACGGSSSSSEEGGGGGKTLNVTRVEKSIEESIFSEKHMRASVSCPAVEQRKGNTFTCYASGSVMGKSHKTESFKTPFTVEQLNDKGNVYYHS